MESEVGCIVSTFDEEPSQWRTQIPKTSAKAIDYDVSREIKR